MKAAKERVLLRYLHLAISILLALYIYSPLGADPVFAALVRFGACPVVIITGVWMWQQGRINRLRRSSRTAAGAALAGAARAASDGRPLSPQRWEHLES